MSSSFPPLPFFVALRVFRGYPLSFQSANSLANCLRALARWLRTVAAGSESISPIWLESKSQKYRSTTISRSTADNLPRAASTCSRQFALLRPLAGIDVCRVRRQNVSAAKTFPHRCRRRCSNRHWLAVTRNNHRRKAFFAQSRRALGPSRQIHLLQHILPPLRLNAERRGQPSQIGPCSAPFQLPAFRPRVPRAESPPAQCVSEPESPAGKGRLWELAFITAPSNAQHRRSVAGISGRGRKSEKSLVPLARSRARNR